LVVGAGVAGLAAIQLAKKKGAIENYSLSNGQVCAWGSIVRSTY
jgi:flavin-dependent dehydrogenase